VKIALWGTRGSVASPGPETTRYGGNTSCVEVRGHDGTYLVLDAGTGIRRLGNSIVHDVARIDIFLTHLHMDHVQGLGFFRPLYRPGQEIHIWGPPSPTLTLHARLSRYFSPPLFPVRLRELPCRLALHDVPEAPFTVGEFEIRGDFVCHPGPTVGYRITEGKLSAAYVPDHEPGLGAAELPADRAWVSGYDLCAGADLLIHDVQYTEEEYADRVGWGHSSVRRAVEFAHAVGARRLVTFHHDPSHNDATCDALLEQARGISAKVQIAAGIEGASFDV
jgi:phosphoribosyl 1,2-cyclic phosphodiesterase